MNITKEMSDFEKMLNDMEQKDKEVGKIERDASCELGEECENCGS